MEALIQISRCLATPLLLPFSGEHSILPIALISANLTTVVNAAEFYPEGVLIARTRGMELPKLITLLPSLYKCLFAYCGFEPL